MVRRDEFGATEIATSGETAATAVAEQARAAIQARHIVAMQRPRDLDDVRTRLLKECKRPSFAKVAIYHKPVGKGVEGLSIRFAEAAMRYMGNLDTNAVTIWDDPNKRIMRVSVIDLESNNSFSTEITIEKTVERSKVPDGVTPLGARQNSSGRMTYLIPATEDDLLNKQNALISKAIRTNGLRHVPGDIQDEAKSLIYKVQGDDDAKDPDAARKALSDAFSELGVMPSGLKDYLGHDFATASPAEIKELRGVYVAIRDGEATWQDALTHKQAKAKESGEKAAATPPASDVKTRMQNKAAPKQGDIPGEPPNPQDDGR
jgi:hypothetical protein